MPAFPLQKDKRNGTQVFRTLIFSRLEQSEGRIEERHRTNKSINEWTYLNTWTLTHSGQPSTLTE